ncbi:MAG: DinB family protein [Acidobacteriota bacterium]
MSIIDSFIAEFVEEAAHTRRALERAPEERFDWAPHPKSMTMARLASHLAELPQWAGAILDADEFVLPGKGGYTPFMAKNRVELLETFDRSIEQAKEKMEGQPDEKMTARWRMKSGDRVVVEAPRIGVMKQILLNHAIHHRGQLTVYLRLNDIPVPAIYGPSADEQTF